MFKRLRHLLAISSIITITCIAESFSQHVFAVKVALPSDIRSVAAQSGCIVVERMNLPGNIFIVNCTSSLNVKKKLRSLTNQVIDYEEQLPEHLVKQQMHFTDPDYDKQWYLNNTRKDGCDMQVEEVWKLGLTGKGIVVAIVDDGVNFNHVDLKASHNKNASVFPYPGGGSYFPAPGETHGTSCAGIIASRPNNLHCGVGIAHGATIGSIRLLTKTESSTEIAKALSHEKQLIHIYSNSWKPNSRGSGLSGPKMTVRAAIEDGVKKGRNGLGSIYLFSAGNDYYRGDNCGFNGYINSPYIMGISGLSNSCRYPDYVEGCAGLFATSFTQGTGSSDSTGILTTLGVDNTSCQSNFTGTSASVPMAAGAVALMLEANGELTWRDVQHIIALTARQDLCPKKYGSQTKTNGRGLRVSYYCGFGVLSVERMVTMAKIWTTVPTLLKCRMRREKYVILYSGKKRTISYHYQASACLTKMKFLESVHVKVIAKLGRRGFLDVIVKSPQNTTSTIIKGRPHDDETGKSNLHKWPQKSIYFWGENPYGVWTVKFKCKDHYYERNFGILQYVELLLYGTAEEPIRLKKPDVVPEWLKKFSKHFYDSTSGTSSVPRTE